MIIAIPKFVRKFHFKFEIKIKGNSFEKEVQNLIIFENFVDNK